MSFRPVKNRWPWTA